MLQIRNVKPSGADHGRGGELQLHSHSPPKPRLARAVSITVKHNCPPTPIEHATNRCTNGHDKASSSNRTTSWSSTYPSGLMLSTESSLKWCKPVSVERLQQPRQLRRNDHDADAERRAFREHGLGQVHLRGV